MTHSTFHIAGMDCPTEEELVRLKLEGFDGISDLRFDLAERRLTVAHVGDVEPISKALGSLGLGETRLEGQESSDERQAPVGSGTKERRPLMLAFGINFTLFAAEFVAGLLAGSMGLVADSLDMAADSFVYGLSLAAVGRTAERKRRVARLSGYFQMALALLGLLEVVRRLVAATESPDVMVMVVLSLIALSGNVLTLWILSKANREEAHMQASWIFTSNDVKVNALVILAGGLVYVTGSAIPDLLAGGLIFLIVANGAKRILALSRPDSK